MRTLLFHFLLTVSVSAAHAAAPTTSLPSTHRNYGLGLAAPLASLPADSPQFREQSLYTPAEFDPATELQMTAETFQRMHRQLVGTVDRTADLVVIVRNSSEARSVASAWKSAGGAENRLRTQMIAHDSFWYQDYSPFYSVGADGKLVSNDFVYNRYNRVNDDAVPERLAQQQGVMNRKVTMFYEGGNFISDGKGRCFATSRIYQQNPQLSQDQVKQLMAANLGCRELIVLTAMVDDITFHIDLWAKMIDDHTFLVGDLVDHPRNKEIVDKNAATLAALGYNVVRFPVHSPASMDYRTHVNAFFINGYVILPEYGGEGDREAVPLYEKLGFKPIVIDVSDLTGAGGAVHCILRSKPRI